MDDILLNDVYENFIELKKEIGELKIENEKLKTDNRNLKNEVEELESQVWDLENAPTEQPINLDDVVDEVINKFERKYKYHPNPAPITLDGVVDEVKRAIKSFSS